MRGVTTPRYGVAVVTTAGASLVALFLSPLSLRVPFVLFAAAVIVSSLEGGLKPGLLATTLSTATLAIQFWLLPLGRFHQSQGEAVPLLVLFVVVGLLSSYLGEQCWRVVHAAEWMREAVQRFDSTVLFSDSEGYARLINPVAQGLNGNQHDAAIRLPGRMLSNAGPELQPGDRSTERLRPRKCKGMVAAAKRPVSKNRARSRRELQQREEQFRSLAACAPAGILQMDLACRCVYANCSGQLMGGFSAEEGKGNGWARFLHPEDRARIVPAWVAAMRAGKEFACEFRFQTPPLLGSRWVRLRSSPMVSDLGKLIGHVAILHDIDHPKLIN